MGRYSNIGISGSLHLIIGERGRPIWRVKAVILVISSANTTLTHLIEFDGDSQLERR